MKLKKSLCVLVQHGVCVFRSGRRGPGAPTEYLTSCDQILRILRYPRYIYTAKTLYGDTGELIIEELLQRGEMTMSSTVKTVANRLTQNMEGQYLSICISQKVFDKLLCLLQVFEDMLWKVDLGISLSQLLLKCVNHHVTPANQSNMSQNINYSVSFCLSCWFRWPQHGL